ncbi:Lnp1p ASCRUDRAFT_30610 [Ascoidea rubescens DSM 1968]|uniref:Endoplasmic reticulum junction formation protein lunapark n=1 Tax=Ascoidea rubescens DSM 1968 TaxID=1344418 RepID=A0A1D2VPM9_9ASCO|nr:hypothetical protein ASCRUDRAFT_30610 [Ascoidea rubescens DSM 1968]ODV63568.1 hypothetical protein ASCRUDRAFT_30610 [Ascoidea rubescens DSM 1968]
MGWFFFSSKKEFNPLTFEKELDEINKKIVKNEKFLVQFRKSFFKYKKLFNFYTIIGYLLYLIYSIVLKNVNPNIHIHLLIILLTPVIIYTINLLLNYYYNRRIVSILKYIKRLRFQHDSKIRELKEKTNFLKTKRLLKKYNLVDQIEQKIKQKQELKKRKQFLKEKYNIDLLIPANSPLYNSISNENNKSNNGSWYDSIFGILIGSDEVPNENRYALICLKCFQHNGLGTPGKLPHEITYVCPKCGFLNNKNNIQNNAQLKNGGNTDFNMNNSSLGESSNSNLITPSHLRNDSISSIGSTPSVLNPALFSDQAFKQSLSRSQPLQSQTPKNQDQSTPSTSSAAKP